MHNAVHFLLEYSTHHPDGEGMPPPEGDPHTPLPRGSGRIDTFFRSEVFW